MANETVFEMVNERIMAALEAGTVPWRRPWQVRGGPRNLVSNKSYRGVNAFLLGMAPYASPYWLTMNQCNSLGGKVRKGEKSTVAVFWKIDVKPGENEGDPAKRIPILRYFRVFNLDQCEDVRVPKGREIEADTWTDEDRIAEAEMVIAAFDGPRIKHEGDRAFYMPAKDVVVVPDLGSFDSPHAYYSTMFHELGHSTGHSSRHDRFSESWLEHMFGSPTYAREELVAEMTAAYLCAETGIDPSQLAQNAAYIKSWQAAILDDPKALVVAAGKAQKAADLILGRTYEVAE